MKKIRNYPVLVKRIFLSLFVMFFACSSFFSYMPTYAIGNNSNEQSNQTTEQTEQSSTSNPENVCTDQSGGLSWIVCSSMTVIAKATDAIYGVTQDLLDIDPISTEDGSAIHTVWEYARNLTNIIFIILLLIVVYSQLTGVGISNYGIKRVLPRIVVVVVLINLSFLICQIAIDASNILGFSLRGFFESIQTAAVSNGAVAGEAAAAEITWSDLATALTGGSVVAGIGVAAISGLASLFWVVFPILIGALVAVVIGLITIAMRQALVSLLVMISPLAFVCFLFPNTEKWFTKWKNLLIRMLVFYPVYSILFGASQLAGWAIIASASNAFGVVLGLAVQVFPLFFSWSLMKMSGTILGTINQKLHAASAKPMGALGNYTQRRQMLSKARYIGSPSPRSLSQKARRRIHDRQVDIDERTKRYAEQARLRGISYSLSRYRNKDGNVTALGEEYYQMQADTMGYQKQIEKSKNDFNMGLGMLNGGSKNVAQKMRLGALDAQNVIAADTLKYELARGAKVEADNTIGFYDRTQKAIDAHFDDVNQNDNKYQRHFTTATDLARYNSMLSIMDGNSEAVHYIGADAAYSANAQRQIVGSKFTHYFNSTVPTQDVVYRLSEFTSLKNVSENIDPVISGLRILNQRGDTNIVRDELVNTLVDKDTGEKKIDLGTYASQALASFLMFDVKDNDPTLRRFGKYINLETAKMYNYADPTSRRRNSKVTYDEYINGEYEEYDVNPDGSLVIESYDAKGNPHYKTSMREAKRSAAVLLEGTSFKGMGRTTLQTLAESIRDASFVTDESGRHFDIEKFKKTQDKIWNAILPNIIGDQFSFLSGSEEIKALAKGLTGMNANHTFDWEGIFGADIANTLTDDQKKDYIKTLNARTSKFFGGHVPNQLARTKTDMLNAMLDLFLATSAIEDGNDSILNKDKFTKDEDTGMDEYKDFQARYGDQADRKLIKSVPERYMKGYYTMKNKGNQGDAKASLDEHLHIDDLATYHPELKKDIDRENRERAKAQQKARREARASEKDDYVDDFEEDDGGGAAPSSDYDDNTSHDTGVHYGEITSIYMKDQAGSAYSFFIETFNYLIANHLDSVARSLNEYYSNNRTASRADLYNYVISLL